jgi:hypothetical protein
MIFRLEFNLPYLALRASPPSEDCPKAASINKTPRRWIDLSFLKLRSASSETEGNYGIHEVHISFALSGSDHERWTAFAFVDTAFDDEVRRKYVFQRMFWFSRGPNCLGSLDPSQHPNLGSKGVLSGNP